MTENTKRSIEMEHPKLLAWLKEHGEGFKEALGYWCDSETMALLLSQLTRYSGHHFPMFKNDIDRHRCRVLCSFLEGGQVETDELRTAVALLMQSFNAAVERLYFLERRSATPPQPRPPMRPKPPKRPGYVYG